MNAEHEWYRQHQVFLRNVMENAWSRRDPRVLAARTRRPASNETASLKALWQAHHLYYGVPQAWWDFTTGNRNGGLAGNVTQGRCRSCNVVIQWVPKCCVVKLVRDAYCPRWTGPLIWPMSSSSTRPPWPSRGRWRDGKKRLLFHAVPRRYRGHHEGLGASGSGET